MVEFVTASQDPHILHVNLGQSPIFKKGYSITVKEGFTNIPNAYNSFKKLPWIQYVCYVHNDVYLPDDFERQLQWSLQRLPGDWEVLGVAGVKGNPKVSLGYIEDRKRKWGNPFSKPLQVDTLDELLIITRGDISFDPMFPLDFYAADICIGRKCYVIPCFVHHNSSRTIGGRTESFYESQEKFKKKWSHKLPINTTCAHVS